MTDENEVVLTEELTGELELIGQAVDVGRVVPPGDVLVLSAPRDVSPESAAMIREQIEQRLPALAEVMVMAGIRFEFVFRSDEL